MPCTRKPYAWHPNHVDLTCTTHPDAYFKNYALHERIMCNGSHLSLPCTHNHINIYNKKSNVKAT
ncbi:hypothetical protein Taro_055652 [Colocasia esculenta]|uniref:Uncharacterized protein n=1 Tax=Colocasia esculenta TaxID=4460 RepID=A0A843XUY6_COLES|nr:hypothetical protein [Colocasia esculenta]